MQTVKDNEQFKAEITILDFEGDSYQLNQTDEKGLPVRFILLTDGRIAKIRTGKGKDVEKSTMIAGGDQAKYLSAMMASVTAINGVQVVMEDLSELSMKDYMRIQIAHADINF